MASRQPHPRPEHYGPVEDSGVQLNLTAAASPYSHGLAGVDQSGNYYFANILVASFFCLMAISLLYRWFSMGRAHIRHLFTLGRREDQRYWMFNHSHFWPRIKRNLIYAPLWRNRHNKEIQLSSAITIGTLPSRYHTLLISLYLACNIAYCAAVNYNVEAYAIAAELRGRTGSLASLNLIPAFLFALRNNPLIPILGVSFDTFNLLHRYCARVFALEALAHTACWAWNANQAGGQKQVQLSLATSQSYAWGMVGTCAASFILVASLSPIRHAFYETFLNGHRLMVTFVLVGVYIHLDRANLPQLPYVQLCMSFWLGEWVWRSLRICYHNVSRKHGFTRVTVEALPAEACRVTFDLSRPWRWTPGCHVHAYLPAVALWSSHPFSIAWAQNRNRELPLDIEMHEKPQTPSRPRFTQAYDRRPSMVTRPSILSKASGGRTIETISEKVHKDEGMLIDLNHNAEVTSVSLIMRARTGMTRKIYEKAAKSQSGSFTTWGAIEGPYGGHESFSSYGTVVLFAGGVGITHCVGYVHHLMLQHQARTSSTQKILLVWSVPNTEALEWVRLWMDKILKMEGRRDVLRIQLYVTKPRHRAEVQSSTGSVQMFPGRCNPRTIVNKEMQERIGAMGVMVCGPGAFGDAVRSAVRDVTEDGAIDFVEEAFTY